MTMSDKKVGKSPTEFRSGNKTTLIRGGREYFDLVIALIDGAKEIIHLQTYIFDDDQTGQLVARSLSRAAQRNVKVYLIVDGYASQRLGPAFVGRLEAQGIHFRFFEPLYRSKYYYFGRRLHHKILAVDSQVALVGGINISDNYNDLPGKPAWFDFALKVEGPIVRDISVLCSKTWNGFSKTARRIYDDESKLPEKESSAAETGMVAMRRNDWVRGKNQVSRSYQEIFTGAKSEILLVGSYFLPGSRFRKLMTDAVRRGVKIKLVLAGRSDVGLAKQAERHTYQWLLKHHIELYEYRPSILHAKLAIADDQWMTLGSYNVNNISAFASIELNLDVKDSRFVRSVREVIQDVIERDCVYIRPDDYSARPHLLRRIWEDICYQAVNFLIFISTFYYRQQER